LYLKCRDVMNTFQYPVGSSTGFAQKNSLKEGVEVVPGSTREIYPVKEASGDLQR